MVLLLVHSKAFASVLLLAVGEPGCCMASTALFAAKRAIEAARLELGLSTEYFRLGESMPFQLFIVIAKVVGYGCFD